MRLWHRLINDSQLLDMEDLPAQTYLEHRYLRETPTPVRVLGTTTMAFGQGTDVTGGYRVRGGRSTGQLRLFLAGPCQFMARRARG